MTSVVSLFSSPFRSIAIKRSFILNLLINCKRNTACVVRFNAGEVHHFVGIQTFMSSLFTLVVASIVPKICSTILLASRRSLVSDSIIDGDDGMH